MPDLPDDAVEAAARALVAWQGLDPDDTCDGEHQPAWMEWIEEAQVMVTAAAPHIAAQERTTAGAMTELFKAGHEKNRDLRAGVEALRDEWQKGAHGRFENSRHPGTLGSCAAALDALLREGE